jgi:hypothetical protein
MAALTPDLPQVESAIIALTNEFRGQQKLAPVKSDPVLRAAARAYAEYLARTKTFSHTADGRQPSDRVTSAGYKYCQVAENLALNQDSRGFTVPQLARDVVEGWKNSPGHRRNLVAPHVTEIGVGVARRPDETYLSVQLFGRPESARYQFRIDNLSATNIALKVGDRAETLKPRVSVRYTQCLPSKLTFETTSTGGRARNLDQTYEPKAGDHYVIEGATPAAVDIAVAQGK